jgi:uncharacterized membrane protein
MDYLIAKYLHLLGLTVWLGMIPYEALVSKRLVRTRSQQERHRLLFFSNKLRFYQEYPSIILVFTTGAWLVSNHGLSRLLQQEWFIWKIGALALLVFAEVYLTHDAVKMQKECERAMKTGEPVDVGKDSPMPMIIGTMAIVGFSTIMICAIFKQMVWSAGLIVLIAVVPPFIAEYVYYSRWRAGRYLEGTAQGEGR